MIAMMYNESIFYKVAKMVLTRIDAECGSKLPPEFQLPGVKPSFYVSAVMFADFDRGLGYDADDMFDKLNLSAKYKQEFAKLSKEDKAIAKGEYYDSNSDNYYTFDEYKYNRLNACFREVCNEISETPEFKCFDDKYYLTNCACNYLIREGYEKVDPESVLEDYLKKQSSNL